MRREAPTADHGIEMSELAHVVQLAVETAITTALQGRKRRPAKPPAKAERRVATAAAAPIQRSHRGFRGLPPPPEFDLDALPAGNLLTEYETAAATRLSTSTLAAWRKRPDHPLAWVKIGTRVRYRAGSVRQFIASGRRPQPGRPRKKDAAPTSKPPKDGTSTTTTATYAATSGRRRAPRRPRAAEAAASAEAE